ncbi:hypothetical protein ACA910_011321 [Epithemia clementina (nom. ined.)]
MKKTERERLSVALAILDHLKLLNFLEAARSLETEIKKRNKKGLLPSTKHPVVLRWEPQNNVIKDSVPEKSVEDDAKDKSTNKSLVSSLKSNSSQPNKRAKTSNGQTKIEDVTPEEEMSSKDSADSDVSDTDVSDVSSVEVSTSESSEDEDSSDSDAESSGDEEQNVKAAQDALAKKKEAAVRKAREAAEAALNWKPSPPPNSGRALLDSKSPIVVKTAAGTDGAQALSSKGKPFKRVDSDYWGAEAAKAGGAAADNSYEGVFGSSGFGARSSEKLLTVRGKDFRHEKTKRKRSFNGIARTGGQIDTSKCFSTKFHYSDDEQ